MSTLGILVIHLPFIISWRLYGYEGICNLSNFTFIAGLLLLAGCYMAMKVFVTYPILHFITELIMYFKKLRDFAIINALRCPMLFAYVSNPTI